VIAALGWLATLVFAGSYLCRTGEGLRRVQMLGAVLWIAYGLLVGAAPVVAANALLLMTAAWTWRSPRPGAGAGSLTRPGGP
jgi:hypothetical protein